MMHVPRGGRPPWGGGGGWQRPMPPWGGGGGWGRPRPPWQGGGWGRPMPPWAGGGGWQRPMPRLPFGPFGGGPADGGWARPLPYRRPWGSNPFNPFGPRPQSKAIQALLQAQRERFNEATIGRPNKNPLNVNMTQAAPVQGITQEVPMQVAELATPATTTASIPPPPRRPRIAVDPVRRRRMYPSVVRNKGGLMKRRYA